MIDENEKPLFILIHHFSYDSVIDVILLQISIYSTLYVFWKAMCRECIALVVLHIVYLLSAFSMVLFFVLFFPSEVMQS